MARGEAEPARVHVGRIVPLEPLDPRPQLHLPGPSAARLHQHMQIALRDGIGIEQGVRLIGRRLPARACDSAVDHKMRHMNALGR